MSGTKRERMKSDTMRSRVRQMLSAGMSVAAIAKETGKTYRHTERIVAQETAALAQARRTDRDS